MHSSLLEKVSWFLCPEVKPSIINRFKDAEFNKQYITRLNTFQGEPQEKIF